MDSSGKGANTPDWMENYPGVTEDIDEVLTDPWGKPLSTKVYFDYDHSHDHMTQISVSGVMCFVGSTPISWYSKRQGAIDIFSYSTELCSVPVETEEAISMQ